MALGTLWLTLCTCALLMTGVYTDADELIMSNLVGLIFLYNFSFSVELKSDNTSMSVYLCVYLSVQIY